MKTLCLLMLIVPVTALSGCVGALGGGASYRVQYTLMDGATVDASADTVEAAESVDFTLSRDAAGKPTVTFKKTGVQPGGWTNEAVTAAFQAMSEALRRIPAPTGK